MDERARDGDDAKNGGDGGGEWDECGARVDV